jgi:NADPH-dependent 2,4-dienoyl-CoA reductase/sulfur reductase-like enzyme/rhodanese-related sulfurtransferase
MHTQKRSIVIVGASAAGLRCACRLSRLEPTAQITVIEQSEIFSYAACGLPYVLSGDIEAAETLRRTGYGALRDKEYFSDVKGIKVVPACRAVEVDPKNHQLTLQTAAGNEQIDWDELVLATGSQAKRLPGQPEHPRVRSFHSFEDLAPLHNGLAHGEIRRVAIVGAGLVGCELAEAFSAMWGAEVVLLEAGPHPLPMILDQEASAIVAKVIGDNDVDLQTSTMVEKISADDKQAVVVAGGKSFTADMVIVALGVSPASDLAKQAGVELGPSGAIEVDQRLATSVENIWAVGDCVQFQHKVSKKPVALPLGSLANRQGRTLANILAGRQDFFPEPVGATAVKIFDLNVAAVGLSRYAALAQGFAAKSVWIHAHDRADYWPDSKDFALQLTYASDSLKVLGVQAAGQGEVAKRIDVAAQLIANDGDLIAFSHLEHAYAPPYAPAIDPLAVAAFVALNQEDGVDAVSPLTSLADKKILDVRNPEESQALAVADGQVECLPLDRVRGRFAELDLAGGLVVCARGIRSAELCRWLAGQNVKASYLGGGMRWRMLVDPTR